MSVWDVDDALVDELGERVGQLPFVSHCYRRPGACLCGRTTCLPWCMGTREEVEQQAQQIAAVLGGALRQRDILYSTQILKKTGLRRANPALHRSKAMFRISEFANALARWGRTHWHLPPSPPAQPKGPVVIWNLIRRCNLTCKHCYALSADTDYAGELSTAEALKVMGELKKPGCPHWILSGGEPLMRKDIFRLAEQARAMKFYTGLSTNGTLIDADCADRIAATGFNYVGISLDGIGAVHDKFRRLEGGVRPLAASHSLAARTGREGRPALHHDRHAATNWPPCWN